MPLQTFHNLDDERKKEIERVLRSVFFNKPLAQVHVSEIVKQLQVSRGAFYKYFEDLNDAFEYIVDVDKTFFHREIIKSIELTNYQLIDGLSHFLNQWIPESPDDLSFQSLHILKQTNPTFTHKRHQVPQAMLNQWQKLLELNHFHLNDVDEAVIFLYFLMDLVMQSMILALNEDYSKEMVLKEFKYKINWLVHGVQSK
ncbi:TetR/AcrR family transcriptional regulator [Atopobacter phocae]|uniref:TetR/AcrR family transcriptional regulator n=1 Tax=Atopobacter phocae TaxID=136492 RepID=UPI00047077EB|nr:TetR/AcrR family transcriptional regulator [Atopobacter phocae]